MLTVSVWAIPAFAPEEPSMPIFGIIMFIISAITGLISIYCLGSAMLNYLNRGVVEITFPLPFKRHVHKYDTRMMINDNGDAVVQVYCSECMTTLNRTTFQLDQLDWLKIGIRRGFHVSKTDKSPPRNSSNQETWWVILGLTENATKAQIRSARRKLAAMYHPDNKKTGNPVLMAKINNAADIGLKYAKG